MQFLAGVGIGIPLAFLGLVGGLLAMVAAVVVVLLFGLAKRAAILGGALVGLGGFWLGMFAIAANDCAGPGQPCGATPLDLTPHIVVSIALVVTGVVSSLWSTRTRKYLRRGG